MKRLGILVFQNILYTPYLKLYTNILDNINNIHYEVIYYNRNSKLNELQDNQTIPIQWYGKGTNAASKIEKLINFFIYKLSTTRLIKIKQYDFLIILGTVPAVLMSSYLVKKYKKRYIIDIRDYTQEHNKIFFHKESIVVNNSVLNVVSSRGFLNFLPESKYISCHNMDMHSAVDYKYDNYDCRIPNEPIVISYIGGISYEKQCIQLINLVDKDDRFIFELYGNEMTSSDISNYVRAIGNPRITMKGAFLPSDKPDIYKKCDIVFNCYGNDSELVKWAISNKHYDAALYHRPLLVSPNTLMSEIEGTYAYPLDLDTEKNLNNLFDWYMNFDRSAFIHHADTVIADSIRDNRFTEKSIIEAIKQAI